MAVEWGHWPFTDCKARAVDWGDSYKCDLRRGHKGDHAAERGMYWIVWSKLTRCADEPEG